MQSQLPFPPGSVDVLGVERARDQPLSLRDDLNTFIPCYSCSSYLSSFSRSSRLTQTPRLSSLRIYNNISLISRVWTRLRLRSCTARFNPAVQRVELESRRLLSCTAPASLLIRDHSHQPTSRGPWPYITSTVRMSDSEDDKPLVKGAYCGSLYTYACLAGRSCRGGASTLHGQVPLYSRPLRLQSDLVKFHHLLTLTSPNLTHCLYQTTVSFTCNLFTIARVNLIIDLFLNLLLSYFDLLH